MRPHVQHQQRSDIDGDIALLVGQLLGDQAVSDVLEGVVGAGDVVGVV